MRGKFPTKLAVSATALALFAAGCQSTTEPEGPTGGTIRVYATEMSSLVPGEASDNPSIQVIRQLFTGLVAPDPKDGSPKNQIAESITSTDNITWTVKLKNNFKFHNGEPVNAESFINAWNYTAYGPSAAANSHFMEHIAGYADLQAGKDPDGDGPQKAPAPKTDKLSGLNKIDDFSFSVKLDKAFVGFPAMVGYSGFYPQPKACFAADAMKDGKQVLCKEKPIGNGRYKIVGAWEHNSQVRVARNDDYAGPDKGKPAEIVYRIYDKDTTGYSDFEAGELDVMYTVPAAKYQEIKGKYGQQIFERPNNSFQFVGFPTYDPRFANPKVREAFSYAIDRQQIIDKIFFGRFTAAEGVVSPLFKGYRSGACKACKPDPAKAQALLKEAGGWSGGKVTLWANAGAGHDQWMAPLGDMLKNTLGIEYELKVDLQFTPYLATAGDKKFTGPYRLGWGPDYALLETYLAPLYGTNASSNYSGYSNPEFDALVVKGNEAKTEDEAIKFYQQAEDIILRDLPVLPMWFGKDTILFATKVKGVSINPIAGVEYHNLELS